MTNLSLALSAVLVGSTSGFSLDMKAQAPNTRRQVLQKTAALTTSIAIPAAANAYAVPDLNYPFEALEPYIDAPTMKIHHDKHHGEFLLHSSTA